MTVSWQAFTHISRWLASISCSRRTDSRAHHCSGALLRYHDDFCCAAVIASIQRDELELNMQECDLVSAIAAGAGYTAILQGARGLATSYRGIQCREDLG